jgi:HTH-type transcriptional regulator, cell division transcriptional repressor
MSLALTNDRFVISIMKDQRKTNIVGDRVREARLNAKPPITQEDLVARLQVQGLEYMDQAKISRIESGTRPVYDYEVVQIARALNVSVNWLLSEQS